MVQEHYVGREMLVYSKKICWFFTLNNVIRMIHIAIQSSSYGQLTLLDKEGIRRAEFFERSHLPILNNSLSGMCTRLLAHHEQILFCIFTVSIIQILKRLYPKKRIQSRFLLTIISREARWCQV